MKWADIVDRAEKEKRNITVEQVMAESNKINDIRKKYPGGCLFTITNSNLAYLVEKYCDENDIPFYHVAEDCYSTAETYADLKRYEDGR